MQVICFTRKIKSEVAEEHHLVAISDYCVMLTQWRLNQYDLGRFLGKITSLLIKFYNLKCKLGSFLLQLIKTVQWQNWFTFLSLWMWEKTHPPQKNRTLFTFFLMILMMNRPDGSLSFLLTLSKTLFLNREHDLFLKKTKLFITSQQTGMTILRGFLFICFQITKTLIFFFRFDSFLEP